MAAATSSSVAPVFEALLEIILVKRSVSVAPGKTLFTVIWCTPNSLARVLLQLATAPRMVFETPNPVKGIFTEVEITFIILP